MSEAAVPHQRGVGQLLIGVQHNLLRGVCSAYYNEPLGEVGVPQHCVWNDAFQLVDVELKVG